MKVHDIASEVSQLLRSWGTQHTRKKYMADWGAVTIGPFIVAIAPNRAAEPFGGLRPGSIAVIATDGAGNVYASEDDKVVVLAAGGTRRVLASGVKVRDLAIDSMGTV